MTTTNNNIKRIDRLEFVSPISMEGSWGARNIAKEAKSTMELFFDRDNTGWIEWEIYEHDLYQTIGLAFDIGVDGKRTLTDYDGVMTLPDQAMDLLERNGVDCAEMRKAME